MAQLNKVTEPNFISEADIYVDQRNNKYSDLITLKFKDRIIDLEKGKRSASLKDIKANFTNVKNFLKDFKKRYGNFSLEKAIPSAVWGDTIRTNKRTGKKVFIKDMSQVYKIKFDDLVPVDSIVSELSKLPFINYASGPYTGYLTTTPNDTYYTPGYQWELAQIDAPDAWSITTGSSDIIISINDFFDYSQTLHEDLDSKVVYRYHPYAASKHGTIVAGVAAAETNNNQGLASIGWNSSVMFYSLSAADVREAVDRGTDIINFCCILDYDSTMAAEIYNALQQGVIVVAGAGNSEYIDIPDIIYPAAYNFGEVGQVIAVSATKLDSGNEIFIPGYNCSPGTDPVNDTTAFIDISAPGGNMYTFSDSSPTGYLSGIEGTSLSAPMVSGLVSLMLAADSTLTPNQIYDILTSTADKVGQYSYDANGWNQYMGYGRINAYNAVNVAQGAPNRPQNLHFTYANQSHPSLGWDTNSEVDISSYKIYRNYDDGNWVNIGTVSHPTNTYVDYVVDYTKPIWAKSVKYHVKAVDNSSLYSIPSNEVETTGIIDPPQKIAGESTNTSFELMSNYPNPFNPSTKITFSLSGKGYTQLKVYNSIGEEVAELVNNLLEAGIYSVDFNAANLPSGIYLYKLTSGKYVETKKMILLK